MASVDEKMAAVARELVSMLDIGWGFDITEAQAANVLAAIGVVAAFERIEALEGALGQALTWEGRLNQAEQMAMQPNARMDGLLIKGAVQEEVKHARALLDEAKEET